ncbi:hypothetical protein B9D94_21205 [Paenibacillus sp. Cedars]|nr:hypothetical protein B9D94_21205 [Paenibacillus sp. Cedars]
MNPLGPAERTYRFRKSGSGRLKVFHRKTHIESIIWSRISSSVTIIPEIRRQQRLEERYDRGAGFTFLPPPNYKGEKLFVGMTSTDQRRGRIDSRKAVAVG